MMEKMAKGSLVGRPAGRSLFAGLRVRGMMLRYIPARITGWGLRQLDLCSVYENETAHTLCGYTVMSTACLCAMLRRTRSMHVPAALDAVEKHTHVPDHRGAA